MSRTVPSPLQTHLDGATTSTATLWRITRQDGAVLYFTDHDADIAFGGNTYVASVGYQRTDIGSNATLAVDSLDLQGILNSAEISETDLRGGRYNYAAVRVSLVNWKDPDGGGEVSLVKGWLGEAVFDEVSGSFTTELRSLFQVYQQNIIEQYGRMCRYDYGDGRCNRDNTQNVLPPVIANNTAYAVGDVVRVPVVGASNPAITQDYNDTNYRVTLAGTTNATLPFVFHSSAGPDADTGATTLSVTAPSTFTRPSGSFLDDGFVTDMVVVTSGFANGANNGTFRITGAVTALSITVTAATLVTEAGGGDDQMVQTNFSGTVAFAADPAIRVAGEVLSVESQSVIVAGGPGGPGGGGLIKTPVFFTNPGAEQGTLAGWTVTQGTVDIIGAPTVSGNFAFRMSPDVSANSAFEQSINVTDWATEIDGGAETMRVDWFMYDLDGFPNNFGTVRVDYTFRNAGGGVISSTVGADKTASTGQYVARSQTNTIPALTRTIDVAFVHGAGGKGNMALDDIAATTSFVDTLFPDDEFNYGVLTFDSGLNAGLSFEVKDYDSSTKTFTLYLPASYPIAVGDKIGVHIGCNKELSRCLALANVINHGGFPTIPGDDEFLSYPDSPY